MASHIFRHLRTMIEDARLDRHAGRSPHRPEDDARVAWERFVTKGIAALDPEDLRDLVPGTDDPEESKNALQRALGDLAERLKATRQAAGGGTSWEHQTRATYREWTERLPARFAAEWLAGRSREVVEAEAAAALTLSHRVVVGARLDEVLAKMDPDDDPHNRLFAEINKLDGAPRRTAILNRVRSLFSRSRSTRNEIRGALKTPIPTVAVNARKSLEPLFNTFEQEGKRPFIPSAIRFEMACGAKDEIEGAYQVIEGLMDPGRAAEPNEATVALRNRVPHALHKLSAQGARETAAQEYYDGVLRHLKERVVRARDPRNDNRLPADFELMEGLDGVSAMGAAVYRCAQLGVPLSVLAGWIRSGLTTNAGTIQFGPREREELLHVALAGAREYATESVIWSDSSLDAETQTVIRDGERRVAEMANRDNQSILHEVMEGLDDAAREGRLPPERISTAAPYLKKAILKLRAREEVRALSYGDANDSLDNLLSEPNRLPHLLISGEADFDIGRRGRWDALAGIRLEELVQLATIEAGRWREKALSPEHDRVKFRSPNERVDAVDPSLARRLPNRMARQEREQQRRERNQRNREQKERAERERQRAAEEAASGVDQEKRKAPRLLQ